MIKKWQIQEAKNRLSQVVNDALHDGPQVITVRGKPAVIILSIEEYQRLKGPQLTLSDFFKESPYDVEIDVSRSNDFAREVDL